MAITNAQRDKAWIDMINGKRKTAGGKIIRTKADLLEVKQYLPMVSQAVKDAYNKRMASFRDSADSVESIAAKYCHEMHNDALSRKEVMANLKSNIERVDPYSLPFAGIAILEQSIEDAKIKMKQLAGLEKSLKDRIAFVESKVAKMSPEDRKIAKMVRNQYRMKSKIKGL